MVLVPLPRLALVASLAVLGVSLAGFASAAGLASGISTTTAGEVSVNEGTVIFVDADSNRFPVADAADAERIEVADEEGLLAVTTQSSENTLTDVQRETAAQIAVSNATLVEQFRTADGVTVAPLRADKSIDSQLRHPEIAVDSPVDGENSTFRPIATDSDPIALERVGPQYDERRTLVVVEPVDNPGEYRAVVNLDTETVDRIFQFKIVS